MFRRFIASFVCVAFVISNVSYVRAQDFSVNQLPVPGRMVNPSESFAPLALKGLVVNLQKPLEFQFIVDTGDTNVGARHAVPLRDDAIRLIKYFLAGLTIPEGDLWVNLSPYEKSRITTPSLGQTELGRDLLAQDYILKQLTASLIYPEKDLGKEFWNRIYKQAQAQFGTINIPVNTFNKVWILPDQAQVFEHGNAAYVTKATLKVMLDEDYVAMSKHTDVGAGSKPAPKRDGLEPSPTDMNLHSIGSHIVRSLILPAIEKEVNTGKNFAPLRQIYQALILAKWYKETIQNGLLDAVYTNKNKITGVNLSDPTIKQQIYNRYLQAYKKGVFNYIKEEPIDRVIARSPQGDEAIHASSAGGSTIPRKYFSGGMTLMQIPLKKDGTISAVRPDGAMVAVNVNLEKPKDVPMNAEVAVQWLGERSAQGIFNREVFEDLKITQPEVLERIKKIVTQFPGNRSWDVLHDGEFGYNEEKRTVRIKLKKELMINGEIVDEIHVQGVLFTKEGYDRQDKYQFEEKGKDAGKVRGLEFDEDGRLIKTPFKFILLGGQPAYQVKQKYDNSLRMEAQGIMRVPIALGYLSYDSLHVLDRKDEKLGIFIYAQRKNVPERILKQMRMLGAPLEKLFELYGRALRESYNFQEDPSLANITLDISEKQKPIYHDLKEAKFRRDFTPLQVFAYRFNLLASGFHRALEFMQYNDRQRVSLAIGLASQTAYAWFLKGFFYDKVNDKRFRIGLGRVNHSVEDADPNAEPPNLIQDYMTLDSFGSIDLAIDEKLRQNPQEVIPMHWRSMVPFVPLLYEIEQTEYQYQPNYVNLAIAQAYQNLQSGASIEEQSLEVFHQLLLLGATEDLVNIDTAIDILRASRVSQYSSMIDFLVKNGKKRILYEEIANNMPDLKISPEDIRTILKRPGTKLKTKELNAIRSPVLSFEYFKKEEEQKAKQLIRYVQSLKVGTEVWEERLSPQFKLSLVLVQQALKKNELGMIEVTEKPGAWVRKDQAMTADSAMLGQPSARRISGFSNDKAMLVVNEGFLGKMNTTKYAWDGVNSKFDALPFPGISIIDDLDIVSGKPESYGMKKFLSENVEKIKNLAVAHNTLKDLLKKIAFVSYDSFHATILDLIAVDYKPELGQSYEKIRPIIEEVVNGILIDQGVQKEFRDLFEGIQAKIAGIDAFPAFLKFNIEIGKDNLGLFTSFRELVRARIKEAILSKYGEQNADNFSKKYFPSTLSFIPHITIGYIVNQLSPAEVETLYQELNSINQNFQPISFKLGIGKLMEFKNMDTYESWPTEKSIEDVMKTVRSWYSRNVSGDDARKAVETIIKSGNQQIQQEAIDIFRRAANETFDIFRDVDWDHFYQLEDGRVKEAGQYFDAHVAFAKEMLHILGSDSAMLGQKTDKAMLQKPKKQSVSKTDRVTKQRNDKPLILVVDDDDVLGPDLKKKVESIQGDNYEAVWVDSVEKALSTVKALLNKGRRFAGIFCDTDIGNSTGYEFYDKIRGSISTVPFIATSAWVDESKKQDWARRNVQVLNVLDLDGRNLEKILKEKMSPDAAMLQIPNIVSKNPQDLGGIDLNPINLNRTGKTVTVQFDPAQLNELVQGGFEGFSPVIIKITPIPSPLPLLGVAPRKEPESLSKL